MRSMQQGLEDLMTLDGVEACCVVDSDSGLMLARAGSSEEVDLEVACAGNIDVVRSKRRTMKALALDDNIHDILITLRRQYHVIRPFSANPALFIYVVLDKAKSNLALARLKLASIEKEMSL